MHRFIFFLLIPFFGVGQSYSPTIHLEIDDGLQQVTVWTIAEDSHHRIWLGNPGGIQTYDGFKLETLPELEGSVIRLQKHDSSLYCITTKSLYKFNPDNFSYTKVTFPQSYYYQSEFTEKGIALYDSDYRVKLFYDYKLHANPGEFNNYKRPAYPVDFYLSGFHIIGNHNGLFFKDSIVISSTVIIQFVMYDNNRAFVATHKGLLELTINNNQLQITEHYKNLRIRELLIDYNKNLWMATADEGVFMFHRNTLKSVYFPKTDKNNKPISCWGFCEINNEMYVATPIGIIPVEKSNWENNDVFNQTSTLICNDAITGSGFVLIGTRNNGIYRLKNKKSEQVFFNKKEQLDNIIIHFEKNDKGFLASSKWSMIQLDHQGNFISQKFDDYDSLFSYTMNFYPFDGGMMNARTTGVFLLDTSLNIIKKYKNADVQVVCMMRPFQNNWWGVSMDAGLIRIDNDKLVKLPFPDKRLFTLTTWNDTNLWITGVKGVFRYTEGYVRPFTPQNGFPIKEYNQNSVFKDSTGFIYVGGIGGVHKFHPDSLSFFPAPPTVLLERNGVLLNTEKTINLNFDHAEINLKIQLISISDMNLYNVEIGIDSVQYPVDYPQQINFSVPYGKSIIQVKITDKVHQISSTSNYRIYKVLPFWKRLWFWLVSIILLVLLIVGFVSFIGFIKSRKQNQLARIRIETQQQGLAAVIKAQEDERKRIAKDLHDGIVQQLGGLKMGLQKIFSGKETDETRKVVKVLDESTQELRELSHKMMPRSLGELGLIPALADMLENSLGNSLIQYQFEHFGIIKRFTENIEITIYRITQELINNVIKHSGANKVNVQLFKLKGYLILIVEDNGKGMNTTKQKNGIGLLNISSRLDTINGKVSFEPSPESGTLATVKIPLSK